MAHYETFGFHPEFRHFHPVAVLLLIALVAVFFLVIGAFSQARRSAGQRAMQKGVPNMPPRSTPVGVCQRCRSPVAVEAAYCARCGLAVTRPIPIPMPSQRSRPSDSRWVIYALIALLGVIGVGAFWFMSDSEPVPGPPVPTPPLYQHDRGDAQ